MHVCVISHYFRLEVHVVVVVVGFSQLFSTISTIPIPFDFVRFENIAFVCSFRLARVMSAFHFYHGYIRTLFFVAVQFVCVLRFFHIW